MSVDYALVFVRLGLGLLFGLKRVYVRCPLRRICARQRSPMGRSEAMVFA